MEPLTDLRTHYLPPRTWIDPQPRVQDGEAADACDAALAGQPARTLFCGVLDGPVIGLPHQHLMVMERLACIDELMRGLLATLGAIHPAHHGRAVRDLSDAAMRWRAQVEFTAYLASYKSNRSDA